MDFDRPPSSGAQANPPSDEAWANAPLPENTWVDGRYRVISLLGRGGFAAVYRAFDVEQNREIALKVMSQPPADPGGESASLETSPSAKNDRFGHSTQWARVEALKDEFRRLSQVHHPSIAYVYDFGRCASTGVVFLAQELVEGESLRAYAFRLAQVASQGTINANDGQNLIIQLFFQLLHALDCLHTTGLLHGDIKPSNLLVVQDSECLRPPEVKLIDFGLARRVGMRRAETRHDGMRMAEATSEIAGTPGYCAPEWIRGEAVDARADLYSLAATFYSILTGERAVHGETLTESLAHQTCWNEARSLAIARTGGPVLGDVLARMLDPDPNRRPASARIVALELARKQADLGRSIDGALLRQFAHFLADSLPFVDRGGYRDLLLTRARDVLESRLPGRYDAKHLIRTIVIEAPEGLGKQRLLREVTRELVLSGQRFIQISCWSNTRESMGPFAQLVEQLVRLVIERGDPSLGREWLESFSDVTALASNKGAPPSIRRDERLAAFVIAVARQCPFVLYVADLDRAPDQLHRIAHLCAAIASEQAPVCLCLGTQPHAAVSERLARLARAQLLEYWRLRPFSRHEAIEILSTTLGESSVAREVAELLEDLTGGHPVYFREALRLLVERNVLVRESGRWELRRHLLAQGKVTQPLVARCIERVERTGGSAWKLVICLFLLDAPTDTETIAALTELRTSSVSSTLDRLEGEGLVSRQHFGHAVRFSLAHDAARQAIVEHEGDALNHHRLALATAIASRSDVAPDLDHTQARLLDEASQNLEYLDAIENSAHRLLRAGQPHRFADLMERVVNRLRRSGGLENAPRLLAAHLQLIHHAPGALVDEERELELLQDAIFLGELLGSASAQAAACLRRAELALLHGKGRERALRWLASAERVAALAQTNDDGHLLHQRISIRRAQLALACGSFTEASEYAQAAYEQFLATRQSGENATRDANPGPAALSGTTQQHVWPLELGPHPMANPAVVYSNGIEGERCCAAAIVLATLVVSGDFAGAIKLHRANREYVAGAALIPRITYLAQLGLWHALDSAAPDLDGWLAAGEVELRAASLTRLLPIILAARGEAALARADLRAAELALGESLSLASRFGQSGITVHVRARLALALARRGALSEATALIQESMAQLELCNCEQVVRYIVQISAAEVAHLQGQSARAWRTLEELGASLRLCGAHGLAGLAEDLLHRIRCERQAKVADEPPYDRSPSSSSLRLTDTDRPTQPTHTLRREPRHS